MLEKKYSAHRESDVRASIPENPRHIGAVASSVVHSIGLKAIAFHLDGGRINEANLIWRRLGLEWSDLLKLEARAA